MSQLFALVVYTLVLITFAKGAAGRPSRMGSDIKARQQAWTLDQEYLPQDFLDQWNFWSQPDPTHGLVNYLNKADALAAGLVSVKNGSFTLAVDDTTQLAQGTPRNSVRISSQKSWSSGLFIFDAAGMPAGPPGCSGIWPAYWSVGPNWPNGGEIDVVEGVNDQGTNQMTLHTGPDCNMSPIPSAPPTGQPGQNKVCTSSGGNNAGCAYHDGNPQSYGKAFNDAGGGVFAHILDSTGIRIWHFARADIPQDITNGTPDPTTWGEPVASFSSSTCNTATKFYDHVLTINITVCGDWAGAAFNSGSCPGVASCEVAAANPDNFKDARWTVNKIRVYTAQ